MPITTFLAFVLLGSSILSIWIKRDPKIWGTLLVLCLGCGWIAGLFDWVGLAVILVLSLLWLFYDQKPNGIIFSAIAVLSISLKLHLLPGFHPYFITSKFAVGLENPLIGLFPLALLVPLFKIKEWKGVIKGLGLGLLGICALASLAILSGATHLDFKIPSFMGIRVLSNFLLTSIPEEGFYRGFLQKTLGQYFKETPFGNGVALVLSSLIFAISHLYWSPNLGILAFTFLAGLLYGTVYVFSGKIESAILTHFLFNIIHMTMFSYHAL